MRRWIYAFFVGGIWERPSVWLLASSSFPMCSHRPLRWKCSLQTSKLTLSPRGPSFMQIRWTPSITEGETLRYTKNWFSLEEDFEVGPGPAFHVYLAPNAQIRTSSDVKGTMYIDLGKLRAFRGSQNYPIPEGVDLKNYPSVVIWCAEFGVLISPADLAFES